MVLIPQMSGWGSNFIMGHAALLVLDEGTSPSVGLWLHLRMHFANLLLGALIRTEGVVVHATLRLPSCRIGNSY